MKRWALGFWVLCLTCWSSGQAAHAQSIYRYGARNVYAGTEATFLAPLYSNATAATTSFTDVNGNTSTFVSGSPGASQLGFAPRLWVGAGMDNGWGFRARFWELNNSAFANSPIDFTTPGSMGVMSQSLFNAYAVDAEITKELYFNRSVVLGTFGVRNGGFRHQESSGMTQVADLGGGFADLLHATNSNNAQFYGTGLTSATQIMRPFYQGAYGNLDWFFSGRGSVLWGNENSSVFTSTSLAGPGSVVATNTVAGFNGAQTMYVGELQAGVQWNKVLTTFNHLRAFARISFEYQNWSLNTGHTNHVTVASGRAGADGVRISAGNSTMPDLNLVGFGVATGFYW